MSLLQPINQESLYIKYADDLTVVFRTENVETISTELNHIYQWAKQYSLTINNSKTKEIIFKRSSRSKFTTSSYNQICTVNEFRFLGIVFNDNMKWTAQVNILVSTLRQRMFLLYKLKSQNMSKSCLQLIFSGIIMSKLRYGIVIWGGGLTCTEINKIDRILKAAYKAGFTTRKIYFCELLKSCEMQFFTRLRSTEFKGLTDIFYVRNSDHNLRNKLYIPPIKYSHFRKTYATKILFSQ
jgi:hypothetical protein